MDRSQDNITSWFVRRRLGGAAAADGKLADGKAGKRGKQRRKEDRAPPSAKPVEAGKARGSECKPGKPPTSDAAPAKAGQQPKQEAAAAKPPPQPAQQQPRQELGKQPGKQHPAPASADEKRHHPHGLVAAAAAVADRAKEAVKTAAAAADAEEERQRQQQQQQPQRAAEAPAPASGQAADAAREREGEHGAGGSGSAAKVQKAAQAAPTSAAPDKPPAPQRQSGQQAEPPQQLEEDEEAEDRPRVVAYSDSDSDVESHIQRVKHHLLPSKEEEEEAAAAAAAAEAAAAEASAAATAAEARRKALLRRLARAGGGAAKTTAHAAAQHLSPGLAVRAGSLLALSRAAPRAATALGALGIATPLAGAAMGWAGLDLAAALPAPLLTAGQELSHFGKAAVAIAAQRLVQAGLRRRRRAQQQRRSQHTAAAAAEAERAEASRQTAAAEAASPAGRLLRQKSSVNVEALLACSDLGAAIQLRQPQTAAEWAAVYAAELSELRRMLQENGIELPQDRFDDSHAELMRFGKACGLLEAKTPEQRAASVEAAFSRVVHTAEWVSRQRFLTDRELRKWDRLVAWKAHDASGRPILLARLGRAQQLVKPERYEELASVLLTLVHRGLTCQLSNAAGAAEKMVVVLDCRGGSSMGLTRHMGLLKRLAITLNEHYPDRLFKLHLLELPLLLRWALHGVMPLLHPHTRSKVVLSSITDPDLAVTVAFLTKRRSSAAKATLRRTLSNCSFLSSGDSTPALLSPQTSNLGQAAQGLAAAPAAGAASAADTPELRHRLSVGRAASVEACIEAPPPALPAPLSQAQAQVREQLGEDDVPHTPPPTLKAPQSPREPSLRARRQLQHRPTQEVQQAQQQQQQHVQAREQGRCHHPHHPAHHPAPHLNRPEPQAQHAQRSRHAQHRLEPVHEVTGEQQQQQQQQQLNVSAKAGLPSIGLAPGSGLLQSPPPSPFHATRRSVGEHIVTGSFQQEPGGPGPSWQQAAAAAVLLSSHAAASAAAGPSSHAVPWSPGMHSPGGSLSRDSSFGEELVPAARTKAAADAALGWEQGQAATGTAAAAVLAPTLAHHSLLRTESSAASSTCPVTSGGADQLGRHVAGGGGTLAGLAATLAALLPSRPRSQQQALQPLPGTSSSPSQGSAGSCGGSPCTPTSARRRDGLTELPQRPLGRAPRGVPGRGLTPRKSSLRRSQSADSFGVALRRGLGSHPLRRQSSVSWAEELEMVKEIAPLEASPAGGGASPLRARLTAANRQHLLLTTFFLVLMTALLAHRLGLSSML